MNDGPTYLNYKVKSRDGENITTPTPPEIMPQPIPYQFIRNISRSSYNLALIARPIGSANAKEAREWERTVVCQDDLNMSKTCKTDTTTAG